MKFIVSTSHNKILSCLSFLFIGATTKNLSFHLITPLLCNLLIFTRFGELSKLAIKSNGVKLEKIKHARPAMVAMLIFYFEGVKGSVVNQEQTPKEVQVKSFPVMGLVESIAVVLSLMMGHLHLMLVPHPFITRHEKERVDLATFVQSIFDPTPRLKYIGDVSMMGSIYLIRQWAHHSSPRLGSS